MAIRGDAAIARTIAAIHADSWRSAYRGIYGDSFLDNDVHRERHGFWRRRIPELRTLDAQLFLATVDGVPAGFSCVEFGAQCTHGAYIDNLHVLPDFQGHGMGRALVDCAAAWARARGVRSIYLFVFEGNAMARGFYAATGWRESGRDMHTMVTGATAPVLRLVKFT